MACINSTKQSLSKEGGELLEYANKKKRKTIPVMFPVNKRSLKNCGYSPAYCGTGVMKAAIRQFNKIVFSSCGRWRIPILRPPPLAGQASSVLSGHRPRREHSGQFSKSFYLIFDNTTDSKKTTATSVPNF